MDPNESLERRIEEEVIVKDDRYKLEAYLFVMQSLDFLIERLGQKRHVTGQELSKALRDLALKRFGPTARMVLQYWGINKTDDIGYIVYNLIGIGLMGKTENDRLQDFFDVYDFEDEFVKKYRFSTERL